MAAVRCASISATSPEPVPISSTWWAEDVCTQAPSKVPSVPTLWAQRSSWTVNCLKRKPRGVRLDEWLSLYLNPELMHIKSTLLLVFLTSSVVKAQQPFVEKEIKDSTQQRVLYASLLAPEKKRSSTVVLFIAGSGPTDRDGNSKMLKTNSTKLLAEALATEGIASLRYDKIGSGKSTTVLKEEEMTIENAIKDATQWIDYLKKQKRFLKIIVAGHSEGSLIGMVCSQAKTVDAFISLAGTGRPIDEVILEQLHSNPYNTPEIIAQVEEGLNTLKRGDSVTLVPPYLMSLLRPSVQPYMRSWLAYDPRKEIKKLVESKKPILIIQGTTDLQVSVKDAELLYEVAPTAVYRVIEEMNHIFKRSSSDRAENMATYSNPALPLHESLPSAMISFIKALD